MKLRVERFGEGVTLYHGDCLEALRSIKAIDCMVTDPPYASGGFTESAKKSAKGMGLRSSTIQQVGWFDGDAMTASGAAWLLRQVAVQAYAKMPSGGTATVFTDWRMVAHLQPAIESARFRFQNLVVWNKDAPGLGTGFRAQHELAMHYAKGTPRYFSMSYGNVLTVPRVTAATREHQTMKPVELMAPIIETVADENGVVFDPFMGSGSTGVACVKLGRHFIGCEVEDVHFDTACRRIEAAMREPMLLRPKAIEQPQEVLAL